VNLEPLSPATLITSSDVTRPYVLFNPTGPVRAMNVAAEMLLGVTSKDAVGVLRGTDLITLAQVPGATPLRRATAINTRRDLNVHRSVLHDTAGRSHGELWELIDPAHQVAIQPHRATDNWSWFAADANGARSPLLERLFSYAMAAHEDAFEYEDLRAVFPGGELLTSKELPTHQAREHQRFARLVYRIQSSDSIPLWVESLAFPVTYHDETPAVVTLLRVIPAGSELPSEEAAGNTHTTAQLEALINQSSDAFVIMNSRFEVTYANRAFGSLAETPHEVKGLELPMIVAAHERDRVRELLANFMEEKLATFSFTAYLTPRDGVQRHVEMTVTNRLDDPLLKSVVATIRDITERVEIAQNLAYQTTHDSLTGLPNHRLLFERLAFLDLERSADGRPYAILLFDIDGFRRLNDSISHESGDQLLRDVAERLRQAVGNRGLVARVSGDEFAILLSDVLDREEVFNFGEQLRQRVRGMFRIGTIELVVDASIGIALATDEPLVETFRQAGTTLHIVKERGGGHTMVFTPDINAALNRRLDVERTLRRAIEYNLVFPYYQPVVHIPDGHLYSHEALVRIEDSEGTLYPPLEFINVAEESGLVIALGQAVLEKACHQLAIWRTAGARQPRVSVNLSPKQLRQPTIVDLVESTIEKYEIVPNQLCLELTENAFIGADHTTFDRLTRLNNLGVRIAIDDFGTGWSSLTYLRTIPASIIKIDQSFTSGLGVSRRDTELVRGVLSLCKALGLTTIAEGVETTQQLEILGEMECDLAQGYLFGRPAPPSPRLDEGVRQSRNPTPSAEVPR
jgi:diguanylate cyclase (GGDEF)-like protein/PAS domain S-box-containing protein